MSKLEITLFVKWEQLDKRWLIPSMITSLRFASTPLFLHVFLNDQTLWANCVFLIACVTDALDGFFARRLGVSSSVGMYLDITADFLLVLTAFSAFVVKGVYPLWALLLISLMFTQFIVTSILGRILYDPVGRYYGAFLFAVIGITLALPKPPVHFCLLVSVLAMTIVSVTSRSVFFFLDCDLSEFNRPYPLENIITKRISTLLTRVIGRLKAEMIGD
jgi:CDP-diacylglycerol--glycerol-3-phosphate 3-phosphatidyltransferase